jgi:hypothetical protein
MADPISGWVIASIILSVSSAAYSIIQAKKMQSAAKKAADARRGFTIPTEGEGTFAPIVYGRALIGGSRVFHATKSAFIYTAPNSDYQFHTGTTADMIRNVEFNIPVVSTDPGYNDAAYAAVDDDGEPTGTGGTGSNIRWTDVPMSLH